METGTYSAGVSRRRFLGGSLVAGAGLAGAALVGCSSTGSKPAGVPTVSNPGSASAAKGPTYASIVGKNWSAREPDAIPKYGGLINGTQNNPQLPNLDPFGAAQAFPH